MKQIPLTRNKFTLVDDEDYSYLSQWKWNCSHYGYAVRQERLENGKKKNILMHRVIAKTPEGKLVDHKNMDRLDNRRNNLRNCTKSQNEANATKYKNNKSGYKGVYKHSQTGKWVSTLRLNNKNINLGCFRNIVDAAKAYNEAATKYFGEFASLNNIEKGA